MMHLQKRHARLRSVTASLLCALTAGACSDGVEVPPGQPGSAGSAAGNASAFPPATSGQAGAPAAAGASTAGGSAATPPTAGNAGTSGGSTTGGSATAGNANGGNATGGKTTGGAGQAGGAGAPGAYVPISFGTTLEPSAQIAASQQVARAVANPSAPTWRAKGDQHRTYHLAEANKDIPYRVCVPTNWDGSSKLPLVMFLHGANNDESSYLDQNNEQMVKLADQHGYVLVSPLGYNGAYGNFLRLPADFSKPDEAAKMLALRTAQTEQTQELSEKDVINVLELVLNEYPINEARMFLTGHSMGSGGTWYIGGKYASFWAALAPMSGPFVLEVGYPWENLRTKPVFVTEGLSAATVAGSHAVRDWMKAQDFLVTYKEVNADHPGMVPLVLPDVFTFFDQVK